ncbi:MAG: phosphoenolpyruvate--protein phosphotransferase [Acidobacteriota bacterium]
MNGTTAEMVFHGNGISHGVALGSALKLDSYNRVILKTLLDDNLVEDEVSRFQLAIRTSKEQLEGLKQQLAEKVGAEHGFILDVHILMLEDDSLMDHIIAIIRGQHANAEWAVRQATDRIMEAYKSLDDEYFRERVSDIENVVERILLNLRGDHPVPWAPLPQDLIVVAHDFNPSAFATMDLQKVRALALESGGRTSHTAIIARSLRLPAVMEIKGFLPLVATGDTLLVNGDEGELVLNPSEERLKRLGPRLEQSKLGVPELAASQDSAAVTEDGVHISLQANTEMPHEVMAAKRCGAEGIGLFRSEFLFFAHPQGFPSMGEQLETYQMLAREMFPYPVAIRTLDAGGDKTWARTAPSLEPNPSMGLRGIRLSLRTKQHFSAQIEAILRASASGKLEIVLPMVSTVEELWEAKKLIEEVRLSIRLEGGQVPAPVPVGAMIEVPAAVLTLDRLAREVDFLCVGTNDLIQYLLAVDRDNPHVAHLFQPLHPSILQCLRRIAETATNLKKPVRICGEMSCNPFFAVLFLGMGYDQLSMNPRFIPETRQVVRSVTVRAARKIVDEAVTFTTAAEIAEFLIAEVSRLVKLDLSSFEKELRSSGAISGDTPTPGSSALAE